MIWLILTILASGILYVIFSFFPKYKVDNLVAIIINYITATICGIFLLEVPINTIIQTDWFPLAFSMGGLFIFIFLLMASSSQVNSISMTSVANKMSLAIPVIAGVILYDEEINFMIILGILLALVSVYLTSIKTGEQKITTNGYFILIALFFGSGLIDTMINYMQHYYIKPNESAAFVMVIFFSAAVLGLIWMLFTQPNRFRNFNKSSIIGGIVLGIPNFGSIFFLVLSLEHSGLSSSVLYPINNMGIVAFSAILGFLIFKEKLTLINLGGIVTAILAIALIAFS